MTMELPEEMVFAKLYAKYKVVAAAEAEHAFGLAPLDLLT